MSILDDAIRDHLDLKRRHGAAESDVKRLEDEAFGPPTRPGEPDFPDSEAASESGEAANGDHSAAAPVASPPAETGEPPPVDETVVEHELLPDEGEALAQVTEGAGETDEPPPVPEEGAADAPEAAATAIFD